MRSRILAALAVTALLMTAFPLTASAHDRATCHHRPGWGYRHPHWYNGWWRRNCGYGYGYGYNENYLGNGGGWWPFFGNGGGYGPYAPAYGGWYGGRRYYYNDHDAGDWHRWGHRGWDRDDHWRGHQGRWWH